MRLQRVSGPEAIGFTTVGYWYWSKPCNKGTLTVQVCKMNDWRHELAVWGHELIEVFYCWLFRITTEQADKFDAYYEECYERGIKQPDEEAGDDPDCPYYIGHRLGVAWEYFCIFITFASWTKYYAECNRIMGVQSSS